METVRMSIINEVPDNGQNIISERWVCGTKDGKVKARLCARGFEDKDLKETGTDSPYLCQTKSSTSFCYNFRQEMENKLFRHTISISPRTTSQERYLFKASEGS